MQNIRQRHSTPGSYAADSESEDLLLADSLGPRLVSLDAFEGRRRGIGRGEDPLRDFASAWGPSAPRPSSALLVSRAADVLADTNNGLSGTEINREVGAYAVDFGVDIPHPTHPFDAPNQRTALAENLMAFFFDKQRRCFRNL